MRPWLIFLLLLVSFGAGIAHVVLGLNARSHLKEEHARSSTSIFDAINFWWCFDKEKYQAEGQKLCKQGQILAIPMLICFVSWYFVL